ncbi:MAG: hypothetical protein HYV33_00630 [Candidatus Kerfeldbacteria bacterium]|nr:hypothetical protein [Candidatus Kerfeldbacteria bacterium]
MFEHAPVPPPITPSSTTHAPTITPPPATDFVAQQAIIDHEATELFKREALSWTQKIILIVGVGIVLGALSAGGIWLYVTTQRGGSIGSITNTTNQATSLDQLAKDTDQDGLRDSEEQNHGTDSTKPDTDGDGLSDGAEVKTHHTDPTLADTDGDALNDQQEVTVYRSDPFKTDTDGDSYTDGNEVEHGYDPIGPGRLNE